MKTSGNYKAQLLKLGEKEEYEYFNHADEIFRFAEQFTKKVLTPESIQNKISYLEWALDVYSSKGTPLFYIENGIAKDQFADPIRKEIDFLNEVKERFIKAENKAKAVANKVRRKKQGLEFDTIISAAVYYYNQYVSTGILKDSAAAFRIAVDKVVTVKGKPVSYHSLINNFDTAFAQNTLTLENGKCIWANKKNKFT